MCASIQTSYLWFDKYVYEIQINYLNPLLSQILVLPQDMFLFPWLFLFIILAFVFIIIPVLIFISLYATTVVLYVYRHRRTDAKHLFNSGKGWKGLLYIIAMLWEAHGNIWHSHEVTGMEYIPDKGPALIIYYHGVIPLDILYVSSKILIEKQRLVHSVGDHFWFMLPGSKFIMKNIFNLLTGPVEECVRLLNNGNLLSIAPGGAREALFGDNRYKLIWNNRLGFARVAIEAKVPIIPVFTQNIRESFIALKWFRCITRPLYELCRLPCVPVIGGFPVKLKTFIGKPIPYDPKVTAEELAQKAKKSIEDLIRKHQKIPGSVWKALYDRFSHQFSHVFQKDADFKQK